MVDDQIKKETFPLDKILSMSYAEYDSRDMRVGFYDVVGVNVSGQIPAWKLKNIKGEGTSLEELFSSYVPKDACVVIGYKSTITPGRVFASREPELFYQMSGIALVPKNKD